MKYYEQDNVSGVSAELGAGAIVAVPTETVYGLAVKYDDEGAIKRLMELKDRGAESDKFFTLMVASLAEMERFVEMDEMTTELAEKYFPGELTLVLPRKRGFDGYYFRDLEYVGIRIPDHEFMLELLKAAGPLVVTSANLKGEEPAKNSGEIERLRVDAAVVGEAGGSLPSTVIRVARGKVEVLRQGRLSVNS